MGKAIELAAAIHPEIFVTYANFQRELGSEIDLAPDRRVLENKIFPRACIEKGSHEQGHKKRGRMQTHDRSRIPLCYRIQRREGFQEAEIVHG